jgi:ribosomal-protein-serine acetyltransferase
LEVVQVVFSYSLTEQTDMKLLEPEHTDELYRLTELNRPFLHNWFTWIAGVRSAYDTRSFIDETARRRRIGDGFGYGIFHEGKLCGVAELTGVNSPDSCGRIGFWLCEEDHGKGRMTRACGTLTDYAIDTCGMNRVEVHAAAGNLRGRAVPERLGYSLEGIARQAKKQGDRFVDMAVYSVLAEEWAEMDRMTRYIGF